MSSLPVIIRPTDEVPVTDTPPVPAVCIVIRHGDLYVAVLSKKRGYWAVLPGGCIDPGETAPQAAARELVEETGLIPTILAYCGFAVLHVGTDGKTYLTDVFVSYYPVDEPVPTLQSQEPEKETAVWASVEALIAGPYGNVYTTEFLKLVDGVWSAAVGHPALDGLEGEVVARYREGASVKALQEEFPEYILPDTERDESRVVMKLQKTIEELSAKNRALEARLSQYESAK